MGTTDDKDKSKKTDPTPKEILDGRTRRPETDSDQTPFQALESASLQLAGTFVDVSKGASGFKEIFSSASKAMSQQGFGAAGKVGATAFAAAGTTLDISDTARTSYKKLAESVAAATGSITGNFVATGRNIEIFSQGLQQVGQDTGQSFEDISAGVSQLLQVSGNLAKSFENNASAAERAQAAFKAYSDVVVTARNVGLDQRDAMMLSEEMFKIQGQAIENVNDPLESSLGLMKAMNRAIQDTGVSMQAASKFVKDNAASYEFLNWSSRKTSLTLGQVTSFAKDNKDVFKSADQALKVYGNALQGTAAIQNDLGKSTFFGTMGRTGGKMGIEAALEFEDLEGPEAMQSITDTLTSITGGKLYSKDEAKAQGGQAASMFAVQRDLIKQNLGISSNAEATKLLDALARGMKTGDKGDLSKAQELMDAAKEDLGGTGADKNYQAQLYSSSEMSNKHLSSIKGYVQQMASQAVGKVSETDMSQLFNDMQSTLEALLPEDAKKLMGDLKSGSVDKVADAIKAAGPAGKEALDKLKNIQELKAKATQFVQPEEAAVATPPAPALGAPAVPETGTKLGVPSTGPTSTPSAPSGTSPSLQGSQPSASSSTSSSTSSTPMSTSLSSAPQPITNLGKVAVPSIGKQDQKNTLAFNAAATTAFASGGALDPNIVGKVVSGGTSEYELGYAMPEKGMSQSGTKATPFADASTPDATKYKPQEDALPGMPSATTTASLGSDWQLVGEQTQTLSAKAPGKEAIAKKLQEQVQGLVSQQNIDLVNKYSETSDPKQKAALSQLGKFMTQMKDKNPEDINVAMQEMFAAGSNNATYDAEQGSKSAKAAGNMELANLLDQWHSTYSTGKSLTADQYAQSGYASSKESSSVKATTTKTGFSTAGIDLTSPSMSGKTDKYKPTSKGNYLSSLSNQVAQSGTGSAPVQFQSAADMQIPQIDSGKAAQAIILEKNKKDAQMAEAKKATSTPSPAQQQSAPTGTPLMAQVVLNVNGNALMDTLVQTTAFEKGVKTQVDAQKINTYKNHGNKMS